jgi:DNA polymerase
MQFNDYKEFNLAKEKCRDCYIGPIYNRVVLSDGNTINPIVMVVGEAAGSSEIEIGKPFVGRAGKLLRLTLNQFGYNKTNSIITNIIPCRPKDNKFPQDEKLIKTCMDKWLLKEIEILKPKFLFLVGSMPTKYLLNLNGITFSRGKWFEYESIPCMPTYHPSYILRKQYTKEGKEIEEHFKNDIKEMSKKAGFFV